MKKIFSMFVCVALLAAAVLIVPTDKVSGKPERGPQYVPGEMLVQFKAGVDDFAASMALSRANAVAAERIVAAKDNNGRGDLVLARFQPDLPFAAAKESLKDDPSIEFVEPNWIYTHQATSNDPYYTNGQLWGMYGDATTPSNTYGSQAGTAWVNNRTGDRKIVIGVIDEGIQYNHKDLIGNVLNPLEYGKTPGVDDDNNGYIDDIYGWDFANGDNTVYDGGSRGSLDKHGTHVAGTIGALGGNSEGVAGVNWSVTMISGKFLGRNGGTTANAIKAVDYFTNMKDKLSAAGYDLVATNNSWGGGGFSQALLDAINRGGNKNILFIAAAGNGGSDGVGDDNDTTANYPSNYQCTANGTYDCVIAVASITSSGAKSGFSNYGKTTVDLGAPGSGIYSTLPNNSYGSYSGTSMATPHVSGGAALYAATHAARGKALRDAITSSTIFTASLDQKTVTNGRLNVSGF